MPITWEVPLGVTAGWLVLSLLLLPAGFGAANWLNGGEFVWPSGGPALARSIGAALTGRSGSTTAWLAYILIGIGEAVLTALSAWAVWAWWTQLGPSARRGMADRREVEQVLGVSRLRRVRAQIRPDLFSHRGNPTDQTDGGPS